MLFGPEDRLDIGMGAVEQEGQDRPLVVVPVKPDCISLMSRTLVGGSRMKSSVPCAIP